jgi:hypothetical protein
MLSALARHTVPLLCSAAVLATAGSFAGAWDTTCRRHDCSNDDPSNASGESVLGDEEIAWRPLEGWLTRGCDNGPEESCVSPADERCYEVALWPAQLVVRRLCEENVWVPALNRWAHQPPRWWWQLYDTTFHYLPRAGETYRYVVRACVGVHCGDWGPKTQFGQQDWIEFVGQFEACLDEQNGIRCERICDEGAPRFFPQLPLCDEPETSDWGSNGLVSGPSRDRSGRDRTRRR